MKDDEIIDFYEKYVEGKCEYKKSLRLKYPDFYDVLKNRYEDSLQTDKIYCIIYRIKNKIDVRPVCPVCGNPVLFRNDRNTFNITCSKQCSISGNETVKKEKEKRKVNGIKSNLGENYQEIINQHRKETVHKKYGVDNPFDLDRKGNHIKAVNTCIERYGVENPMQCDEFKEKIKQTCIDKYGVDNVFKSKEVKEKSKQTLMIKYGVDNVFKSKEVKEKSKQTLMIKYGVDNVLKNEQIREKGKQTCINKYGVSNAMQCEWIKEKNHQTCIEHYGVDNPMKNLEISAKSFLNRKANKISKIEQQFIDYLTFNQYDFIYQYHSDAYPFNCDFYIKTLDLYIEIQGFWTHGKHPFDETNTEDIKILNEWKNKNLNIYNNAIYNWTVRDKLKRTVAKHNGIRYLEIFSNKIDDCINQFKEYEYNIKNNIQI